MKKTIIIIFAMMLISIVFFSGCNEENNQGEITELEIKSNMVQAIEDVSSYKYSASGTFSRTIINETGTSTSNRLYTLIYEVDILNKLQKGEKNINVTYEGDAYHNPSDEYNITLYCVTDTLYTKSNISGNITWKSWFGDNNWYSYAQLERQIYFIFEGAELERLEDDIVGNVDCYVLNVIPSSENLRLDSVSGDFFFPEGIFHNTPLDVDVKYYIAKDTNLLKKANIKLTNNITSFWIKTRQDVISDSSIHEIELLYYDYNIPLTIELPP